MSIVDASDTPFSSPRPLPPSSKLMLPPIVWQHSNSIAILSSGDAVAEPSAIDSAARRSSSGYFSAVASSAPNKSTVGALFAPGPTIPAANTALSSRCPFRSVTAAPPPSPSVASTTPTKSEYVTSSPCGNVAAATRAMRRKEAQSNVGLAERRSSISKGSRADEFSISSRTLFLLVPPLVDRTTIAMMDTMNPIKILPALSKNTSVMGVSVLATSPDPPPAATAPGFGEEAAAGFGAAPSVLKRTAPRFDAARHDDGTGARRTVGPTLREMLRRARTSAADPIGYMSVR
mmetsp:Transcript_3368/g.6985  ORF Transcript_3368/g.6985 Transcript_3368/m.6985 type:complete len:290 (-) Transcript_3368:52-921(-)